MKIYEAFRDTVGRAGLARGVLWIWILALLGFSPGAAIAQVDVSFQEIAYEVTWIMGYGPLIQGGSASDTSPDNAQTTIDEMFSGYYEPTETDFSVAVGGQIFGFSDSSESGGVTTLSGQLSSSTTIVALNGPVGGNITTALNGTYSRFLFSVSTETDFSLDVTTEFGAQVQLRPVGGTRIVYAVNGLSGNYIGVLDPGNYLIDGLVGHASTVGNSKSASFSFLLNLAPEGVDLPDPPVPSVPLGGPWMHFGLISMLGSVSLLMLRKGTTRS